MTIRNLCKMIILGLLLSCQSETETLWLEEAPACACQESQSNSPAYRYNKGPLKGKCLDHCKIRPVQKTGPRTLSDISHRGEFWQGQYDLEQLENVYVLFDRFAPKLNHVALIFMFKTPSVALTHESKPLRSSDFGFVLSPEAMPTTNQSYELKTAIRGAYALAYTAYSLEQYIQNSIELNYELKKYRLNLSPEHQKNLLNLLISKLGPEQLTTPYHLLSQNCATSVLDALLDSRSPNESSSQFYWNLLDPLRGLPFEFFGTKRSLNWWDLVDSEEIILNTPDLVSKSK